MRHKRHQDERQQKRVNGEVTRPSEEPSRGLLSAIPNKQPENTEQEGIITTNNGKSLLNLQQSVSLDNLHIRGISPSVRSWNIKVGFLFITKFNVSASRKGK